LPVVLKLTPYYGGGDPTIGTVDGWADPLAFPVEYLHLLKRGYAVGISSVRGTGNSGGCFSIGGPAEAKDDAAVIEFLAQQPWSNGNIGLMGVSYDGTAPQDAWVEAPPHLKTIVPISGISDLYKYDFVNGVPIDDTVGFPAYYWAIVGLGPAGLELGTQAADPVSVPGAVTGEVCRERVEITTEAATSLLDGNKDVYWQKRDFLAELQATPKKQRGSVFYIHGLDDWNVKTHNMEGWLQAVQQTGVPFKSWLGQWPHAWPNRADWLTVMTAWFDQFLKARDTGILDAPRVQVQDDSGVWRHESKYPPATSPVTLYPQVTGALGTTVSGLGFASYDDYAGAPVSPDAGLPDDRVVFTSAPLTADLHLSGMPRFEGLVTATGDRANLMLTLGDQAPDGTITYLNYAALSLNHAADLTAGKASVAGLAQHVGVNLFPQDNVVKAGHRLVLVGAGNLIQGANPDFKMRPIATGSRVTWDLAQTKLILPQDKSLVVEPVG
jgi:X-Pro dipeptidyl-peptidase